MNATGDDRRAHPRVDLRLPMRYQVLAHVGTAEFDKISAEIRKRDTINISESGVCIRTSEHLASGTVVALIFSFPSLVDPVKAVASVVWCQPGKDGAFRVGLRYVAVRPEAIAALIEDAEGSAAGEGQEKEGSEDAEAWPIDSLSEGHCRDDAQEGDDADGE